MGLLNRIEELEKELLELKELVKEFPQDEDKYWYVGMRGNVFSSEWEGLPSEEHMLDVGNIFKTEDEAYFAVEKLKVDAELRKFSRPFKEDEYNYFIQIHPSHNNIVVESDDYYQTQGTIYFESTTIANEATDTVGADRIKKYIFGVEEQ